MLLNILYYYQFLFDCAYFPSEKLSFPMENKHSQIRVGSTIRCLLTSNNRNFDRDFYLTDAWLPEINLLVGEYPYLLRPAFEEICYIYLNR